MASKLGLYFSFFNFKAGLLLVTSFSIIIFVVIFTNEACDFIIGCGIEKINANAYHIKKNVLTKKGLEQRCRLFWLITQTERASRKVLKEIANIECNRKMKYNIK